MIHVCATRPGTSHTLWASEEASRKLDRINHFLVAVVDKPETKKGCCPKGDGVVDGIRAAPARRHWPALFPLFPTFIADLPASLLACCARLPGRATGWARRRVASVYRLRDCITSIPPIPSRTHTPWLTIAEGKPANLPTNFPAPNSVLRREG